MACKSMWNLYFSNMVCENKVKSGVEMFFNKSSSRLKLYLTSEPIILNQLLVKKALNKVTISFLFLFVFSANAQKTQGYITDDNISFIQDWKNLGAATFRQSSKNYVPKMVKILANPSKYDSVYLAKLVDSIAWVRSSESFYLMADLCCRPINFSQNNSVTQLAQTIRSHGGYQTLNHYYLKDTFNVLTTTDFNAKVYDAIRAKYFNYMGTSYYYYEPEKETPIKPTKRFRQELNAQENVKEVYELSTHTNARLKSVYDLLFVHKTPQNKLDSLIETLVQLETASASAVFWSLDQIAALQSEESFCFLHTVLIANVALTDKIAQMNLQEACRNFGGFNTLNTHFLVNKVDENLPFLAFNQAVANALKDRKATCYFYQAFSEEEQKINSFKQYNTKKMDRKISYIIHKNKTFDQLKNTQSLEIVLQEVLAIPGVLDADYDYCQEKISLFPGWMTLGVRFQQDSVELEKCYSIRLAKPSQYWRRLIFRPLTNKEQLYHIEEWSYFQPGFIDFQRKKCEDQQKRRDEFQKTYQNL